jgi:hypothetical protein
MAPTFYSNLGYCPFQKFTHFAEYPNYTGEFEYVFLFSLTWNGGFHGKLSSIFPYVISEQEGRHFNTSLS